MVKSISRFVLIGIVLSISGLVAGPLAVDGRAEGERASIAGAWTLNKDLSDPPIAHGERGDGGSNRGGGGGYGGGRRRGGGGYGGGGYGGRGGSGQGAPQMDPETMQRVRDALRDITNPPEQITITQTDSMVAITGPDGRTTRLSPDGKKIKDENTGIDRKTKWDTGKLVTEVSGPNGMKITQTYALNPELHQLRLTTQMEGGRGGQARTISTVYDAQK